MRDKESFIESHLHELLGLVIEAAINQRSGGELSLWMRMAAARIRSRLAIVYDQLKPPDAVRTAAPDKAAQPGRKQ